MKIADDVKHEFILKFNEGGGDMMDEYIELVDMLLDGESIFGHIIKHNPDNSATSSLIQFGDTKYSEYNYAPSIKIFSVEYDYMVFDWRGSYVQLGCENHVHEMIFVDNREHPEMFSKEDNNYYIIKATITDKHKVFAND